MSKENDKNIKPKKLTAREKLFSKKYVLCLNAAKAAREAGYSEKTAKEIGHENLTKPHIQNYIAEIKKDLETLCGINKPMVLVELKNLIFSSISHLHDTWITRKEFDSLTEQQKACIQIIDSSVEQKNIGGVYKPNIIEVESVKIKLYDKLKAIEILNKMLGFNEADNVNVNLQGTVLKWGKNEIKI